MQGDWHLTLGGLLFTLQLAVRLTADSFYCYMSGNATALMICTVWCSPNACLFLAYACTVDITGTPACCRIALLQPLCSTYVQLYHANAGHANSETVDAHVAKIDRVHAHA